MSTENIIKNQSRARLQKSGLLSAVVSVIYAFLIAVIVDCVITMEYYIDYIIGDTGVKWQLYEYTTLYFLLKTIMSLLPVLVVFLLSPAFVGIIRMFYMAEKNDKKYDVGDLIYYFSSLKNYSKTLQLVFLYIIRLIIPAILSFLPVGIFAVFYELLVGSINKSSVYVFCIAVLSVLSFILLLIYSIRYFAVFLLYCEDSNQKNNRYFYESKKVINNHTTDIIKLLLSHLPWLLLSITVLPILYVMPYVTQSLCISGKWLIELSRNGQNQDEQISE